MKIEDDNKEKLEGIFRNIDFNSEAELGRTKERNAALKHLIEDFADDSLDLRPSMLDSHDVIGDAYEFLIANFASDAGKKGESSIPLVKFQHYLQSLLELKMVIEYMTQHAVQDHYLLKQLKKWEHKTLDYMVKKEMVKHKP